MRNKFSNLVVIVIFLTFILINIELISAPQDLMALQGNVKQSGVDLAVGNLTVYIYDAYSGGNLIYNSSSDFNNAVSQGKYDVMLGNGSQNLSLGYGQTYYMEIYVNNEKFSFNGSTRQIFQAGTGNINNSRINPRQINSSQLVLNIDLSNSTNISASSINKTTGNHFLGLLLDNIIDSLRSMINDTNTTVVNMNVSWLSTYNITYDGLIQNTSYLSTFNATYVGINNTGNIGALGFATSSQLNSTYLNFSPTGTVDFNGGWTGNGVTIRNGDILAQTGYFVNISGLKVSTLNINGSLFPESGFDNTFDIGNISNRWRDLIIGRNAFINGSLRVNVNQLFVDSSNNYVGIRTSTPTALLEINATNGTAFRISNTTGANYIFVNATTGEIDIGYLLNVSNLFFVNGTRVGINTSNPSQLLEVRGIANFSSTIYYNNGLNVSDLNSSLTIVNMNFSWLSTYNATYLGINDTNNIGGLGFATSTQLNNTFITSAQGNSSFSTIENITFSTISNATYLMNDTNANLSKLNITSVLTVGSQNLYVNATNVGIGALGAINGTLHIKSTDPKGALRIENASMVLFFINGSNGLIGLRTPIPTALLEINSTGQSVSSFKISNDTGVPYININGTNGQVNIGYNFNVSNNLFANGTRVGINTSNPTQLLDVRGTANFSSEIYVQGGSAVSIWLYNQSLNTSFNNLLNLPDLIRNDSNANLTSLRVYGNLSATGNFSVSNNSLFVNAANGFVGINSLTPSYALEINNNAKGLNVSNNLFVNGTSVAIGTLTPINALDVIGSENISAGLNVTGRVLFNGQVGFGTALAQPNYFVEINNATKALNVSNNLLVNGTSVWIGTTATPVGKIEINMNSSQNISLYGINVSVINNNFSALSSNAYGIASYAFARTNNSGIGAYAGYFFAQSNNTGGNAYAIYGNATGTGNGTWAGYFEQGNVFIQNNLSINNGGLLNVSSGFFANGTSVGIGILTPSVNYGLEVKSVLGTNISNNFFANGTRVGINASASNYLLEVNQPAKALNVSNFFFVNGSSASFGTTFLKRPLEVESLGRTANMTGNGTLALVVGSGSVAAGELNYIEFHAYAGHLDTTGINTPHAELGTRVVDTGTAVQTAFYIATRNGKTGTDIIEERFTILPNGSVGINDVSPTSLLELNASFVNIRNISSTIAFRIYNQTGNDYLNVNGTSGDVKIGYGLNVSNNLFVNGTRVGINSANNLYRLEVNDNANGLNASNYLFVNSTSVGVNTSLAGSALAIVGGLMVSQGTGYQATVVAPGTIKLNKDIQFAGGGDNLFDNGDVGNMIFRSWSGAASVKSLYINNTGAVGIHTAAPIFALTIGNMTTALNVSGALYVNSSNVGINSINPSYALEINNNSKALNVSNNLFANATGVGIGTTSTNAILSLGNSVQTNKLYMYDLNGNTDKYGFGIASNTLQIFAGSSGKQIAFGKYDGSTFTEYGRWADGSFGISSTTPNYALEINNATKALNVSNLFFVNSTNVMLIASGSSIHPNPFIINISTPSNGIDAITGLNISAVSGISTGSFSEYGLSIRVNHTSNGPFNNPGPQIYAGYFVGGSAGGSSDVKGVYGDAHGVGNTNVGIYGNASGATTNFAGFFEGKTNTTGVVSGIINNIYVPSGTNGTVACTRIGSNTAGRASGYNWRCEDCTTTAGAATDCSDTTTTLWCACMSG